MRLRLGECTGWGGDTPPVPHLHIPLAVDAAYAVDDGVSLGGATRLRVTVSGPLRVVTLPLLEAFIPLHTAGSRASPCW